MQGSIKLYDTVRRRNANTYFPLAIVVILLASSSLTFQNDIRASPIESGAVIVDTSGYHATLPESQIFSNLTVEQPPVTSDINGQIPIQKNDFTAQAALSLTRATQTNNIVDSRSYYDIIFRTTTSGAIKTLEFKFPPGTYVGAALLVEAVGIGPGIIAASGSTGTGPTIVYTVNSAVNVPAFTNIRIQLANINNPSTPSNSLAVTITTKNSAGSTIDGPTFSQAYTIKQIGSNSIQENAVTSSKIADNTIRSNDLDSTLIVSRLLVDNAQGASFGWNPNGVDTDFIIFDEAAVGPNAVLINVGDFSSNSQCESLGSLDGFFTMRCNTAPPQGSELRYTITNIPLS